MEFNGLAAEAAERELAARDAAPRFAREVAAARPYPSAAAAADTPATVVGGLESDEVAVALSAHPRIGERAADGPAAAASSRRGQSAVTTTAQLAGITRPRVERLVAG